MNGGKHGRRYVGPAALPSTPSPRLEGPYTREPAPATRPATDYAPRPAFAPGAASVSATRVTLAAPESALYHPAPAPNAPAASTRTESLPTPIYTARV